MKQFYAVLQSLNVLPLSERISIESTSGGSSLMKRPLKMLSLVLMFALSFMAGMQKVNAQLVTEDFSYTASTGLVATNGYTNNSGTTNLLTVAASGTGLSYTGSPRSAVGLALPMANTGEDAYKSYTSQTTGAVYASALINLSAVNATGDYFFCLMTGTTYNVRLYAKTSGAGYVLGVGKVGTAATYDATVRSLGTTYLVVIKYQFNTGTTTDDLASLYINPSLGSTEPAANATNGSGTTDAASISSYGFRQGTAANAPTLVIDGIMVGTTWASVTPSSSTPTITPSGNVTGLTYPLGSGPSTGSPVTFTASNLTAGPGNITFTSSTNFEVSVTSATTGFVTTGNTVTLGYTGTGTISPNTVWVRLKAGLSAGTYTAETIAISGGGATSSFTAAGSVTTPTITPSGNVTGLTYVQGSGPSTASSITVTAANLTTGPGNLTLTSSTNFEVSTTSATTGFATPGNTVTLAYTGTGTISPNTVWVRLKAGLTTATYPAETITITGGGASSSFTAAGSVTAPTPTISVGALTPAGSFSTLTGTPSGVKTFTVSGTFLTANLDIAAVAGYEYSDDGFATAGQSSLSYNTATVSKTISVRLTGAVTGVYNGSIAVTSTGATGSPASVAVTGNVFSGTFTSGNLSVETIGDGSTPLSSAAMKINVREYSTTGTLTNTFVLPSAASSLPTSAPWYMTETGTATSAGQINRSADGRFLVLPGYNALLGTLTVASTAAPANKRVIGVFSPNGSVSTTAFDFFSASTFRSIASNGYSLWAAGTVTGGTGLYYLKDANATPVSLGSINTRVVKIFNNKLYYSTATTGGTGIYQVSTNGLPLSVTAVSLLRLTDASYASTAGTSPYAFEINATDDIMYVADDAAFVSTSTERGGILKFTKVSGVWTYQYTLQSPVLSARSLAVDWSTGGGSTPTLYVVTTTSSNNAIGKIIDAGIGSTGTSLVTAGANYVFRGIQFSPENLGSPQLTCTANLLAFGGEPVGFSTPEKVFNVAGTGYSGNINVSIPVTAPTDQYGLSLTPGGPYTSTLSVPNNSTIYMVLSPTAVGTYNGNLTVSATGASSVLVPVTGKGIIPVNYYNVSGADVTRLVNWGTNTNGTGTNPTNFTDDGQYFNITNTPLALASSATTAVIDQTATSSSGNPTLTFSGVPTCNNSPQSLFVGATITGTGIPGSTTIIAISGNTITMSANATVTDNTGTAIFSVAVSGPFTISGSLSKIVVGNGINFVVPSTRAYAGLADVAAGGTLTLQNSSVPTLGTLDATSTVNYNQTGAATVLTATYGNLTLQGSALDARTLPTSSNLALDLIVAGNFSANNVTVTAATVSPFTYMTLGGNLTMSNGAVMVAATPLSTLGLLNIITTGNSNQTFSYTGGGTIRLNTLTSTKSAGIVTLGTNTTLVSHTQQSPTTTYPGIALNLSGTASFVSQTGSSLNSTGSSNIHLNFTGSSTFTLGGNINTSDNSSASFSTPVTPSGSLIASFPTGTSFNDGGNTITVSGNLGLGGVAGAYTLSGNTIIETRGGTSSIGDATLSDVPVAHFNNFSFAPIGGTGTSFVSAGSSIIYIDGNFTIGGTATTNKIGGGSNNTVKIAGNYSNSRTIDMITPSTSVWEFAGSTPQTFSTAFTGGESFFSVKINNASGVTMTTGDFNIGASGNLNCSSGILTTGSNMVVLSATGTITESTTSYVTGNVQSTRTLGTSTDAFGSMGMSLTTATAGGVTTVLRNTGTSNNIGCLNTSVKRTFTVTNGGSALNANIQFTYEPTNELNGLTEAELKLFDVTGDAPYNTASYNNISKTFTLTNASTIAGVYSASVGSPLLVITNPSAVCSPGTVDITDAAVTVGSDAGALSYHTTIAGTTTQPNPNMVGNGTYYIKLTNTSSCTTILPVVATVTTSVVPSVTIAITTGSNPACQGGNVTFTATPTNGGTGESYDWYRNGILDPSSSTNTYSAINISATTPVYAVMTVGTGICVTTPTATSATTTINIISNSWTGSFSNAWGDGRNWCSGTVPTSTTDVSIPVTSRNPVISANTAVKNINIATGATVTMSNVSLMVNGIVTGTGTFGGVSNTNSGVNFTFAGSIGTLYFAPAGIKSLLISGSGASATLGNVTNVYGELNVGNASLNTGGNLTLKSDLNGTAWVAPITSGTITGIVTVERYINRNAFRAWRMLSVPVQGASESFKMAWQENQAPLANGNPGYGTLLTNTTSGNGYDAVTSGASLLSFNNGTPGSFTAVSSTANTMQTNKGYFVYIRGDRSATVSGGVFNPTATTLRTHGNLYIGTQPSITLPAGQNVMVGNVYASAIDFNVMLTNSLVSGTNSFKVWDPKIAGTTNTGGYQTFSSSNGYDPTPGGGSYGSTPNSRIESGHAFILNAAGGGSVQLTESAKTSGSRNVTRTSTVYRQFKASIIAYTINGLQLADGNSVVFDSAYSNNIDFNDAIKSNNIGENFGILKRNGTVLQIDARQPLAIADTIFYKLWNVKQQQYQLRFVAKNIDVPGLSAVLIDSFTNTVTPLNTIDTTYLDITVTSNPASYSATRFRVIFKISAILPVTFTKVNATQNNKKVDVEWKVAAEQNIEQYEVEHSANGIKFEKIATVASKGNSVLNAYLIQHEKPVTGDNFYRIKAIEANAGRSYSKIVKVKVDAGNNSFTVTPNPVVNNKLNVLFTNKQSGDYEIRLVNTSGQILFTKNIYHDGENSPKTIILPSGIRSGMYQLEIIAVDGVEKNIQKILLNNNN